MNELYSSTLEQKVDELGKRLVRIDDIFSGWVGSGVDPYFKFFRAGQAMFDYLPLGCIRVTSSLSQSVSDQTNTPIQFSTVAKFSAAPVPAIWSSANGATSEIRLVGIPFGHVYLLSGHVQFSSNALGRRAISVNYSFGGSSASGETPISEAAASATQITSVNFNLLINGQRSAASGEDPQYIRIDAYQDSGVSLNVIYATLSVIRIY